MRSAATTRAECPGRGAPRSMASALRRGAGITIGLAAGYWLLRGLDFGRLVGIIAQAHTGFLLLVPGAVIVEQWCRAWKWRQVLAATRKVQVHWAFRAQMAGYIPGMVAGFGTSAFIRSWLLARRAGLRTSAVLASSAVDRLIDSFAFALFVGLAAGVVILPKADAGMTQALRLSSVVILAIALVLLAAFASLRRGGIPRWARWLLRRLPIRAARGTLKGMKGFSGGLTWPQSSARRGGVVATAILIKLLATTQYLWAGLAFDVHLAAGDYLFIMVFLGALVFVGIFVRIPGGGLLASLFVLELFGVPKAQALAMTFVVMSSFLLTVVLAGGAALILEGVGVGTLRRLVAGSRQDRDPDRSVAQI